MNIIKSLKEVFISSAQKKIQAQNKRLEQELNELKQLEKEQLIKKNNKMRKTILSLAIFILCLFGLNAQNEFITTWKTDNTGTSSDFQITIPTNVTETYSYNVDWGDGSSDTGVTSDITHTYASIGTYTVKITGTFPQIYFSDRNKILTIEQWGTNPWTSMESAFKGCTNLNITNGSIDVPDLSNVASVESMFEGDGTFNGDLSAWDVSNISNMKFMFYDCGSFNQDIGAWKVGNVVDMQEMFDNSTLSTENYDNTLIGWDTDSSGTPGDGVDDIPTGITFSGGSSNYCNGETAWNSLDTTYSWTITDGRLDCSTLNIGDIEITNLSLYPNPTSDLFYIKGLQEKQV